MANSSLINNYHKIYAEGLESLIKAEALIDFVLQNNTSEIPEKTIHGYFWVLDDLITQIKCSYEALNCLIDSQPNIYHQDHNL